MVPWMVKGQFIWFPRCVSFKTYGLRDPPSCVVEILPCVLYRPALMCCIDPSSCSITSFQVSIKNLISLCFISMATTQIMGFILVTVKYKIVVNRNLGDEDDFHRKSSIFVWSIQLTSIYYVFTPVPLYQ